MTNNTVKRFIVEDVVILLNVQYSKIGYPYPRLFVEAKPGVKYYNLDLTVEAIFDMPVENWNSWIDDVIDVEPMSVINELNLNYAALAAIVRRLKEAS